MKRFRINVQLSQCFVIVVAMLIFAPLAQAQVTTGNLQGVVLDQNRQAVAGAAIKVTNNGA
jgi:hypothetical protein